MRRLFIAFTLTLAANAAFAWTHGLQISGNYLLDNSAGYLTDGSGRLVAQ